MIICGHLIMNHRPNYKGEMLINLHQIFVAQKRGGPAGKRCWYDSLPLKTRLLTAFKLGHLTYHWYGGQH